MNDFGFGEDGGDGGGGGVGETGLVLQHGLDLREAD